MKSFSTSPLAPLLREEGDGMELFHLGKVVFEIFSAALIKDVIPFVPINFSAM